MAQIVARLGPIVEDQRVLSIGGRLVLQRVDRGVRAPADGVVALLEGPAPWTIARLGLGHAPLPAPCVAIAAACVRAGTRRAHLGGRSTRVHLDEAGAALEIVEGRPGDGLAYLLNYAGWRLADFPAREIDVEVWTSPAGDLWVVRSEAVPRPGNDPTRDPPWHDTDWEPPPPIVAVPEPVHVHLQLRFGDLEFFDGGVQFTHAGQPVRWPDDGCQEVLNDLREVFDQELPEGVQADGEGLPDGRIAWDVRGLEGLHQRFRRRRFERLATAQRQRPTWLPAITVLQREDEPEPDDLSELLGIPGLGLDSRADALRRMFRRRDRGVHVQVLWGRSLLIPFVAQDSGDRWWAWETAEQGNATYLFRPPGEEALERLKTWTSGIARRYELLDDREFRADVGYLTKVIHHNGEDDPLGRWWAALCGRVGLPAEREEGEVW